MPHERVQDFTGFFVPPVSANYSFYTRGDDAVSIVLSTGEDRAGGRRIAANTWNIGTFFWVPEQISAPVWLNAGQRYWFRARHSERE